MQITEHFKMKTVGAILKARENYGGSDSAFAKTLGINKAVYSQLKGGKIQKVLSESAWIRIARELKVPTTESSWKVARTPVYNQIENNLTFCKNMSKSMVLVDDCGIGKTFCAEHIITGMKNAFYVDCSQNKTKQQFIRALAKNVGVDNKGRYIDVKGDLKYYLTLLSKPLIVLDEAGDLDYGAFLELKELWNATADVCGWYMMGADGLREKMRKGINKKKVGYAEIFSRFSDEFIRLTPQGKEDKTAFYRELMNCVAIANMSNTTEVPRMIKKCLAKEVTLRYLKTLIELN